jgi:hypothetical protein
MKMLKIALLIVVIGVCFGCDGPADAQTGPDPVQITATTNRTFVAFQDSLASTTKKTVYVLALEDDLEVVAWRYEISAAAREWVRVIPNPANTFADSVMHCPQDYVLPVVGSFDAITIKGDVTGGLVQIHAYK